jgi:hypothetical protein
MISLVAHFSKDSNSNILRRERRTYERANAGLCVWNAKDLLEVQVTGIEA